MEVIWASSTVLELSFQLLRRNGVSASRTAVPDAETAPSPARKVGRQQSSGDGFYNLSPRAFVRHRADLYSNDASSTTNAVSWIAGGSASPIMLLLNLRSSGCKIFGRKSAYGYGP